MKKKNKRDYTMPPSVSMQEFWRTVNAINEQIEESYGIGDDARFSITVQDPTGNKKKKSYSVRLKSIFGNVSH